MLEAGRLLGISLLVRVILYGIGIYLTYLVIKALNIYIKKNS